MPPVYCRGCGRPVSDAAGTCSHCGEPTFAVPVPGHRAPAAPPPGPGAGMRIAQGIALAAALLVNWAIAPNLGGAVFALVLCLGLGMGVLGWSRRTRPYVPFLALGITGVLLLGRGAELAELAEVDQQADGFRALASLDSTTSSSPSALATTTPPRSPEARKIWVMRRLAEDGRTYMRGIRERHGVASAEPLAVIRTARYVANAGSHPEVARYWEGHAAALAEIRQRYPEWGEARMAELAAEAGLPRQYVEGLREGFRERAREEVAMFTLMEELGAAGMAYHRFLVSADPRVRYDATRDAAVFDSDAELARSDELASRLRAAGLAVENEQREIVERSLGAVQGGPAPERP